jgi:hypothetical protein
MEVDPVPPRYSVEIPEISADTATFWTTFDRLMPVDGLYENRAKYGGREPLEDRAVMGGTVGRPPMTWIVNLHQGGLYRLFVRRYNAYGTMEVRVNDSLIEQEKPVRKIPEPTYEWFYVCGATFEEGINWIDLSLINGIYDAILLTRDPDFSPNDENLPNDGKIELPAASGIRDYRVRKEIESAAVQEGEEVFWLLGRSRYSKYQENVGDWELLGDEPGCSAWGSPGQQVNMSFQVICGDRGSELRTRVGNLINKQGDVIHRSHLSLRVARPWLMRSNYISQHINIVDRYIPHLLVRDEREDDHFSWGQQGGPGTYKAFAKIGPYENRQLWISARIPADAAPGLYKGRVRIRDLRRPCIKATLRVSLKVLPLSLPTLAGSYGIFFRSTTNPSEHEKRRVSDERFENEVAFLHRLGFNTVTNYGPYDKVEKAIYEKDIDLIASYGMLKPLWISTSPSNLGTQTTLEMLLYAQSRGFEEPYLEWFLMDEPKTIEDLCLLDDRVVNTDWHEGRIQGRIEGEVDYNHPELTLAASSTFTFGQANFVDEFNCYGKYGHEDPRPAFLERIERPILSMLWFGEDYVSRSLSYGHAPRTYWYTRYTDAYVQRCLAGTFLYARGFKGIQPWAFSDVATTIPHYEMLRTPQNVDIIAYPDQYEQPIATKAAEALGEGIIDVRYLQLLETTIAAAETGGCVPTNPLCADALQRAQVLYDEIISDQTWWHWYILAHTDLDLDERRRLMAKRALELNRFLNAPGDLDGDD